MNDLGGEAASGKEEEGFSDGYIEAAVQAKDRIHALASALNTDAAIQAHLRVGGD